MNFEHFKTCVRAYFPGCNFYWLGDCSNRFLRPVCISDADIRDVEIPLVVPESPYDIPEDDEAVLVRNLKKFSRMPGINPDTLAFGGDMYPVEVTDDYTATVFVLTQMEISNYARPYARQLPGIPDRRT